MILRLFTNAVLFLSHTPTVYSKRNVHMLNYFRSKICSHFEDILKHLEACLKTKIAVLECTFPQKKHNFNLSGVLRSLTLTQGEFLPPPLPQVGHKKLTIKNALWIYQDNEFIGIFQILKTLYFMISNHPLVFENLSGL